MKMNKKKKGFTLIELIAVIAILGILVAVIVPKMTSYTENAKVSKEKANARTILSAYEIYNSTADTIIPTGQAINASRSNATYKGDQASLDSLETTITKVVDAGGEIAAGDTFGELEASTAKSVDSLADVKSKLGH